MKIRLLILTAFLSLAAACGADAGFDPEPGEQPGIGDGTDPGVPNVQPRVAEFDNDSLQAPAQEVFMSITGVREFGHTDEISFPNGDADDFVEFELPNNSNPAQRIQVELDCALEGELDAIVRATLFEDGIATTRSVRCNEGRVDLTVDNTRVQSLRIAFSVVSDPTFVDYTLRVIAFD